MVRSYMLILGISKLRGAQLLVHTYNLSIGEVDNGVSGIQDYLQFHRKFEVRGTI